MFRKKGSSTFGLWRGLGAFLAVMLSASPSVFASGKILDAHQGLPDFDSRAGDAQPPSAQALSIVQSLGAKASWNSFGTPTSLIKYGGYLSTGLTGDPVTAAKNWIRANKALFRLSDAGVDSLELVNDSKMSGYEGHAVLFRQKFGSLPAGESGMITVGITGGKIAYVSSSSAGDQPPPGAAILTPTAAWILSAIDVGRVASAGNLSATHLEDSWTVFDAEDFSHPQRARLVAFPTTTHGARSAFETIVLDVQGGAATAYTHFVDAQTGQILFRQNRVQQLVALKLLASPQVSIFTGTYQDAPAPQACGPFHDYVVGAGVLSLDVLASEAVVGNDIVLKLFEGAVLRATADTATSPETIHYEPVGGVTPGLYRVQVCPFGAPTVPPQQPYNYAGTFTTNDVAGTQAFPYPPKWKVFPQNPTLSLATDDTRRKVWCWENPVSGNPIAGCENVHPEKKELFNLAARFPWDVNTFTNLPTLTTIGNAAITGEAWGSPLTPAEPYRPVDAGREYVFPWANTWKENACSQTVFTPQGNDIDAAVTNLFGKHNRMHDWSYFLGFTERAFNAQDNNFGNTAPGPYPAGRERDPEVGNSQAGAVTGGAPSYLGRDNANQITLNDGVPPITNMYLWQPIAGAFYAPCVDGDFDMSIIGHEYTHLISNRMVGGPDSSLTGHQAGSMGESWSDLSAVEYLNEYGFVPKDGENPFSVGSYVTGNKNTGIRNYAMNANPLNYSDVGYDVGGPEVHSDGEIWDAVNFDVRAALASKYNGSFPSSNGAMQRECADGIRPSYLCPGNRRWIQIVFDAWLLMPAAPSFLDARDAYLGADQMRTAGTPSGGWPSNQKEIWKAFAKRGMGVFATSAPDNDNTDPIPNFESLNVPDLETEKTVTFAVFAADNGNSPISNWKVYVGKYEAGATPIADTDPGTVQTATAKFVTGLYDFLVVAPGYGHLRFPRFFTVGGSLTLNIFMSTNRASFSNGAVATGTGTGINNLIDDTEGTNWVGAAPVNLQQVTVDLQGGVQNVKRVNVSAMLNPDSGGRFTALRQFNIQTCTAAGLVTCALPTDFLTIFSSSASAFPGRLPRPAAPDLILQSFDVPDTNATHVRLQVVTNQCTAIGTGFRGEQDNDLINVTDCVDGSTADDTVRAAELQVFASTPPLPPQDPAVVFAMTAPATAVSGTNITYAMTYTNAGPAAASNAKITDVLPAGLTFVSASNGGSYKAATRTVTWNLGTVNVGYTGNVSLTTTVSGQGSVIVNTADFTADLTAATPAAAVTTVLP